MLLHNLNFYLNKNSHTTLFSFLLYLLPLCLVVGPAPADISITILAIYAVFITLYYKRWDLHFTKISFLILFFNLIILIASILSINPFLSFHSSLFYIRFYFFFIAIFYLINENKNFLIYFFYFLCLTFLFLIFDSFYQFYFKVNIFGNVMLNNRVSSFFGSELILGSYFSRLTPIYFSLLYLLFSKNKFFDQLNFFSIIIFFLIVIISGERVSIFINITFTFAYLIFLYQKQIIKIIFTCIALIIVFFLVITFNNNLKFRILNFSYSQIFLNSNTGQVFTNSPILKTRELIYDNCIINKVRCLENNKYDMIHINKILDTCKSIDKYCSITKNDLISLHNLFFAFKYNKFEISEYIPENSKIKLRKIYKEFIDFKVNKYKKIKFQIHKDSFFREIYDSNINFNINDKKQPSLNIKNMHVGSSTPKVDISNFINSNFFDQIYFEKNNSYIYFSSEHDSMLKTAINIFKGNKIFGSGPRMYRYLCQLPEYAYNNYSVNYTSCSTSPHNIYMQILSETGLFGFIFLFGIFLTCIFFIFFYFYKRINHYQISVYQFILITLIFLNLFPFIPTGNFFGNWLSILFYLPLGFLMYKSDK